MALFALTITANDVERDGLFRALEEFEKFARVVEALVVVRKEVVVSAEALNYLRIEGVVDGRIVSYDGLVEDFCCFHLLKFLMVKHVGFFKTAAKIVSESAELRQRWEENAKKSRKKVRYGRYKSLFDHKICNVFLPKRSRNGSSRHQ